MKNLKMILIFGIVLFHISSCSSQFFKVDNFDFSLTQQEKIKKINKIFRKIIFEKDTINLENNLKKISKILYYDNFLPITLEFKDGFYRYCCCKIVHKNKHKYFLLFKDNKGKIYVNKKGEIILPYYKNRKLQYLFIFNFYYDNILSLLPEKFKFKIKYLLKEVNFENFIINTLLDTNIKDLDLINIYGGYPIPLIKDEKSNKMIFSFKRKLFYCNYLKKDGISIKFFKEELDKFVKTFGKIGYSYNKNIQSLMKLTKKDIVIIEDHIFINSKGTIYELKNNVTNRKKINELIKKEIENINFYKKNINNFLSDFNGKIIHSTKIKNIFKKTKQKVIIGKKNFYIYLKEKELLIEVPIDNSKYYNKILLKNEIIYDLDEFKRFILWEKR